MDDYFDIPDNEDDIRAQLSRLRREHQLLDDEIDSALRGLGKPVDFVHLQRLKKRKLGLKDMIIKLENSLLPDIIA